MNYTHIYLKCTPLLTIRNQNLQTVSEQYLLTIFVGLHQIIASVMKLSAQADTSQEVMSLRPIAKPRRIPRLYLTKPLCRRQRSILSSE